MAEKKTPLNDEELEEVETNIVDALLNAAAYRQKENHRQPVKIVRNKKVLFRFTLEAIDEDTWRRCRMQNTRTRGRRLEDTDEARFLSQLIYEATIDEDKQRIWNNKAVWRQLKVLTGVDVVNAVLLPAEKMRLVEEVEKLSGYNDDLDEMIENL